ncbi:uncharacterized LOC128706665 homolog isoform X1 [Chrysemys picta bellii]|uniref:uncharacterized LOC128706665 homolog isoform X1 n=1 Tax=Chrysemys picta bellii TaxID=8478 RepID=UPI0032B2A39E
MRVEVDASMGLKTIWKDYKVLIVMGTSLGLIHWGWFNIKSNSMFQTKREDYVPEPGIVTYVMQHESQKKGK